MRLGHVGDEWELHRLSISDGIHGLINSDESHYLAIKVVLQLITLKGAPGLFKR